MPQPLPTNPDDTANYGGYQMCLDLEQRHDSVQQYSKLSVLICVRLLGYMIIHAPCEEGRRILGSEVMQCKTDEDFQVLAEYCKNNLIRCLLAKKGQTPPQSRPSQWEEPISPLLALRRDSYRSVISGKEDSFSIVSGLATKVPGVPWTVTRATHIFDWSTDDDLEDNCERNHNHAASVHAVLERFGGLKSVNELKGNTHNLENILTLSSELHEWFNQLEIWLDTDPNDPEHCYRVAARHPDYLGELSTQVHFTTPDPDLYPLPDPHYLAIHAACAKALHLSGAAEYIERVYRDLEMTRFLATDSGSNDVLYHAVVRRIDIEVS